MDNSQQEISLFTAKIQQLLNSYNELKTELKDLKEQLAEEQARCQEQKLLADSALRDYENLKLAKMLEVSGTDIEDAQKRIAKLINSVNKCLTLLGGPSSEAE